ncbi:hypothetical protein [uncultured Marixanthomonas sp.]|mgnify:CR=1 FL=1|uniref:hypothetical protein n=1 Tax=uncultured Marixanthomonas sp. TaxID=757245 RepID=UPI0030DDAA86|tara:strand:+ start:4252 stop:5208 length:957 start_codon:yes stop_codon:yes gene_type:complete
MKRQFLIPDIETQETGSLTPISLKSNTERQITYGCHIIFENKEAKTKNEIRYKMDIEIVKNGERYIDYIIKRHDSFYLNDEVPSNTSDLCLFEAGQFIYPLKLRANKSGKALRITNFDEIKNRWTVNHKTDILEKYGLEIANGYVTGVNSILSSEDIFVKYILNEWFLCLYFNNLYGDYSENFINTLDRLYPLLPKTKPVSFHSKAKIKNDGTYDRVFFKGKINDDRCYEDLSQKLKTPYFSLINPDAKQAEADFKLQYLMEMGSGLILGLDALFNHNINGEQTIGVGMYKIGEVENGEAKPKNIEKDKKGIFARIFK